MAKIKGIDTGKIDEAVINAHLARYGIACTGKLNRKLRILATHIADLKASLSKEDFDSCKCTNCDGESPGILDQCPFCGESGTQDPEDVNTGIPTTEEEVKVEEEPVADTPSKPPKRSTAKKKATKKKSTRKKKDEEKPSEAIVVPSQFSEVDLNQSVAKCLAYMSDATLECFRLGEELNHISNNNLYLLRVGENSKSTYTNFKVFVRKEFGMSHQQAYNLMAVAANFDEDQVRKIGTTKLKLALKVPPEMRETILAAASEGETMSSLSEKANALLDRDTPPKKAPVGKQLTAIIAMGLLEEPMYKAPTQPGKVGEPTTPASSLNDEPFAVFTLENGVEATFQVLKDEDGALRASLAFRRASEG